MKFSFKSITVIAFAITLLSGGAMHAHAYTISDLEPLLIYGPVTKSQDGTELSINNQSGISYSGDISIYVSPEHTRILDAVSGMPVSYNDIADGEYIYSYISQAMTLSLPPKTNSSMILCHIPADFSVPEYIKVSNGIWNSDNSIYTINATNGSSYSIPSDCEVFPYLTKNIVTINDLISNATCLIWKDDSKAYKIMVFSSSSSPADKSNGWQKENNSWFYYDIDGNRHKGWLNDNGKWYYLNPETGIMHTGFLIIDSKTYYLLEDGRLLTYARTFTPNSDGALY